jgi:phage shock protein C
MQKTTVVSFTGHDEQFRLDEAAFDRLQRYLDRAGRRLEDDPDRAEVLGDLERSIGDRLSAMPGSPDRQFSAADIEAVLDEIGMVDTGREPATEESVPPTQRRRLRRIREGQKFAGVCTGLADYADIGVDWVRTGFILGSLVTGGLLIVVYIALIFILPISPTRDSPA